MMMTMKVVSTVDLKLKQDETKSNKKNDEANP